MTEERLGFLCNLASSLSSKNDSHKYLRSYYLMRCNEMTKGYGLPMKHFSKDVRCPVCCLEWSKDTKVNVHPTQPNKKAGSVEKPHINKRKSAKSKSVLRCNDMDQTCAFCKRTTTTQLEKPKKEYIKQSKMGTESKQTILKESDPGNTKLSKTQKKTEQKKIDVKLNKKDKKHNMVNVYSSAFDVFSLKNDKNTLSNTIKEPEKIIKNNKKKKDKFAGLCQTAVLASVKLKEQKQTQIKQNKLNLFLKPSLG